MSGQMQQHNAVATALYDHPAGGSLYTTGPAGDASDAAAAPRRWRRRRPAGLQRQASPNLEGYGAQPAEGKQSILKLMRNLNLNADSGSEPYAPAVQSLGGASGGFYCSEFRGDFRAGPLDLHAADDTELLSEHIISEPFEPSPFMLGGTKTFDNDVNVMTVRQQTEPTDADAPVLLPANEKENNTKDNNAVKIKFAMRKKPSNMKELSQKGEDIVTLCDSSYLTVHEPKPKMEESDRELLITQPYRITKVHEAIGFGTYMDGYMIDSKAPLSIFPNVSFYFEPGVNSKHLLHCKGINMASKHLLYERFDQTFQNYLDTSANSDILGRLHLLKLNWSGFCITSTTCQILKAISIFLEDIHNNGYTIEEFDEKNLVLVGSDLKFCRVVFVPQNGPMDGIYLCFQKLVDRMFQGCHKLPDDILHFRNCIADTRCQTLGLQYHVALMGAFQKLNFISALNDRSSYLSSDELQRFIVCVKEWDTGSDWRNKKLPPLMQTIFEARDYEDRNALYRNAGFLGMVDRRSSSKFKHTCHPNVLKNAMLLLAMRNMSVHLRDHAEQFDHDIDAAAALIMSVFGDLICSFQTKLMERKLSHKFFP